jgi:hypothetical protein
MNGGQHCIAKMPASENNSAFVILFNFSTNAERQEFYFRHFGNALTLGAIYFIKYVDSNEKLKPPHS